jgi:hypothetical protein
MSQYSYFSDYDNGEGKYLEPIIWEAIKGYFDNFFRGEAFSKNFPDSLVILLNMCLGWSLRNGFKAVLYLVGFQYVDIQYLTPF